MINKKQFLSIILLLFLLLFSSCKQTENIQLLKNTWYYSLTGEIESYTLLDVSRLKNLHNFFPDAEGIIYLKTNFIVSNHWKGNILSVFLGRIEVADETFFNGDLIGQTGSFPPNQYNDWNMDRRYDISPGIVNFGESNQLLLKVFVNSSGLIDGKIQIGLKNDIDRVYAFNSLMHRYINILFSFLLLFFGANSLLLYSKRRKDRQLFWFALVSITFAFSQAGIFLSSLPGFEYSRVSYIPFMKLIGILEILVAFFFFRFTQCFFNKRKRQYYDALFFAPSIVLLFAHIIQVNYKTFYLFYNFFEISLAIPSIFIIILVINACIEKREGAKIFLIALIPTALLILHDMILTNLIDGYILMLTGISLPLLLIIMNMIFGLELVKDRNKAEVLNIKLDQTIHQHINELEDASIKLSHTSRKQNFIKNFMLSTREREILGLIIDGLSNDEIAEMLSLSIRTVSAHIYKIYRKTNLHSRTDIFTAFNNETP